MITSQSISTTRPFQAARKRFVAAALLAHFPRFEV
jgi:hypothetical protein